MLRRGMVEKVNLEILKINVVSRDFGGLQMILMNRAWVPDVPLKVSLFLKFCFYIVL